MITPPTCPDTNIYVNAFLENRNAKTKPIEICNIDAARTFFECYTGSHLYTNAMIMAEFVYTAVKTFGFRYDGAVKLMKDIVEELGIEIISPEIDLKESTHLQLGLFESRLELRGHDIEHPCIQRGCSLMANGIMTNNSYGHDDGKLADLSKTAMWEHVILESAFYDVLIGSSMINNNVGRALSFQDQLVLSLLNNGDYCIFVTQDHEMIRKIADCTKLDDVDTMEIKPFRRVEVMSLNKWANRFMFRCLHDVEDCNKLSMIS